MSTKDEEDIPIVRSDSVLSQLIPGFEQELAQVSAMAPSGLVIGFNVTWKGPEHVLSLFPLKWQKHYHRRAYYFADPVFKWLSTNAGVSRWSDISFFDPFNIMEKAKDYGLVYGFVVSVHIGEKKSFITLSRPDREFTDEEIAEVEPVFRSWAEIMTGEELSERELEALRLLASGLTTREIAEKLELSEPAVKLRLSKATKKLGAKSRTQAVAIAVWRRLFS